jgi:hypothetical protein
MMISNPIVNRKQELDSTIERCESLLWNTQKKCDRIGWFRFLVFAVGIILVVSINFVFSSAASVISFIPVVILFLIISVMQSKIFSAIRRQKKWIEIKKSYLARLNIDWANIPHYKEFPADQFTPVAVDLDITGPNSLHRLIDFAKTKEGSQLLRTQLIATPTNINEVKTRQKLINELRGLSHFRDKFLLTSNLSTQAEIQSVSLLDWLEKTNRIELLAKKLKTLLPFYASSLVSIILFSVGFLSINWLILSFSYLVYYFLNQKAVQSQSVEMEIVSDELKKIISTLYFVENHHYRNESGLQEICSPLIDKKGSAVNKLKQGSSILSFLSMRSNPFLWFFFILIFPIDYFIAYKIEKFKQDIRLQLPAWLSVLHKLEAAISLANFSYLNPDYIFPELLLAKPGGEIYLDAKKLGHPLIPFGKRIANDYSIKGQGRVDIFTGSNMAGKSTFLRTVGVNVCLANSGAPVSAESFSVNHFKLFSCIRVSDSVIDGISYFYAEVKRLKLLLDEFENSISLPILFLVDEIFKGTNNLERLKGSEAMIRALVNKNGAGLISTHDLELIKLADTIPTVLNYHFKEEIVADKMIFDYKLHKGPCPTTNALKIMQANGLPVSA